MKKIKKLLYLAIAGAVLASCGNNATKNEQKESENSKEAETKVAENVSRVAYIARTQSDSFAAWLADEMVKEAGNYKDMKLEVFDGQADDNQENSAIENAITNKFDVIIVQPNNGEAQRPYVEQIVKEGIHAITTNARIANIEGSSSVDADPYEQAKVNCELALEQVPKGAQVVVLNGPSGNFHADERRRAWEEEFFKKRPDVKIVGEQIANWNKDEAVKYMEDWVTSVGKIDAVISMNDNMAAGAIEVIKDNDQYKDMLVYGVDGTPEACLLIKDGSMTSTCLQSAIDLAKKNIELAHKLVTGGENTDENIDAILITKDNVDEYIEMYKARGLLK